MGGALAPRPLRLAAVACVALALAALVLTLLAPWGTYLAEQEGGNFTSRGCTGPFKEGEYRLQGFTTALLGADGEVVEGCQRIIAYWGAPALDDAAAVGQLRAGLPLVAVATMLAGVAAALAGWGMAGGRLATLAAGMAALLAAATLGAGIVFFATGVAEQVDLAKQDVRHELHGDPEAFGWALGLWTGVAAGVLLLASAVLAFVPAGGVRPRERPAEGEPAVHEGARGPIPGQAVRPPEGPPEPPAVEAVDRPPGADEQGRPPRRLTCPRCKNRFLGEWGVQPQCPECGFTRSGN